MMRVADGQLNVDLVACEQKQNPAECEAQARADIAAALGLPQFCEGVPENEMRGCVTSIAYEKANADFCGSLEGDDRDHCENIAYQAAALKNLDVKYCERIHSDQDASFCTSIVVQRVKQAGTCKDHGIEESVCDSRTREDEIVRSRNVGACNELVEDDRETCLDRLSNVDDDNDGLSLLVELEVGTSDTDTDSDDDGLTDFEEYDEFGTNPADADTDDDGFDDGTEVRNGFDPFN
jgi:hypothetical protein